MEMSKSQAKFSEFGTPDVVNFQAMSPVPTSSRFQAPTDNSAMIAKSEWRSQAIREDDKGDLDSDSKAQELET